MEGWKKTYQWPLKTGRSSNTYLRGMWEREGMGERKGADGRGEK
jgi:hypothetical protein